MTSIELEAAIILSKRLYRLKGKLEDLKLTGGIGSAYGNTPVQGGGCVSPVQLAAELEIDIISLERQLEIEQEIIRRYLEKLPYDEVSRKLMLLRYVRCYEFKDIRERLGYSDRRVYQIHAEAKKIAVDCSSFQ